MYQDVTKTNPENQTLHLGRTCAFLLSVTGRLLWYDNSIVHSQILPCVDIYSLFVVCSRCETPLILITGRELFHDCVNTLTTLTLCFTRFRNQHFSLTLSFTLFPKWDLVKPCTERCEWLEVNGVGTTEYDPFIELHPNAYTHLAVFISDLCSCITYIYIVHCYQYLRHECRNTGKRLRSRYLFYCSECTEFIQ